MSNALGRVGRYLVDCIAIDTRTLAVFRIFVGLLIIGDLLARASTFTYFYTDDGVVPQELAEARTVANAFSVYFYTQDPTVIALIFLVSGIIAVQLIIGYKSTFAIIASFILVISLDHHNPLILSHADTLFRLLMFWAIFLPLGERWSIDSLQRERAPRARIANLATFAILLQMIYMYTVNGIHKVNGPQWNSREATPLIFGLDDMTYFLAEPLRQFPTLLEIFGTMWYFLLVGSIVMLLLPGWYRTAYAFMLFMAHFSFSITVRIGGFGWVGMAGVFLFFPTRFWDDLEALLRPRRVWGQVIEPTRSGIEQAGRRVASTWPRLQNPWPLPSVVRDGVFDIGMTLLIISLFVFPTIWFLDDEEIIEWDRSSVEDRVEDEFRRFGVRQSQWTVFAPNPRTTDRYYVFPARTADGELLDVYNDRPFTFERPYDQLQKQYGNYRERFYMNTIRRAGEHGTPPRHLADWICRDYLENRGIELTQINMYVINERITRDTIDDWQNRERWSDLMSTHACGDHVPEEFDLPEDPP